MHCRYKYRISVICPTCFIRRGTQNTNSKEHCMCIKEKQNISSQSFFRNLSHFYTPFWYLCPPPCIWVESLGHPHPQVLQFTGGQGGGVGVKEGIPPWSWNIPLWKGLDKTPPFFVPGKKIHIDPSKSPQRLTVPSVALFTYKIVLLVNPIFLGFSLAKTKVIH